MILSLSLAKEFLRIDDGAEDASLGVLIGAAEEYLFNATGKTFDSTNHLAQMFCLVLVSDWYENRLLVGKVGEGVRPTVNSMLAQLENCDPPEVVV